MKISRLLFLFILIVSPILVPLEAATSTAPTSDEVAQQIQDTFQNGLGSLLELNKIRGNSIAEYLNVHISPQNPKPGDRVHISIESYLTDLNKAAIKWAIDNKVISQGIGATSFSFPLSSLGGSTKITLFIATNAGDEITRDFFFNPVGLTVLWEADTYTPPFYKGKALITPQARVRAIAIPNEMNTKNALNAGTLAYTWKQNGIANENTSGYGKNTFTFTAPRPYEQTKVSVTASSLDDALNSEFKLSIPVTNPFILFHEDHPLLGIWYNKPIGKELTLMKKEFSLRAEPYFFSKETRNQTLVYEWSLNGKDVINPGLLITLRNETGTQGDSALSLAMHGLQKTFQTADRSLTIHFSTEEPRLAGF